LAGHGFVPRHPWLSLPNPPVALVYPPALGHNPGRPSFPPLFARSRIVIAASNRSQMGHETRSTLGTTRPQENRNRLISRRFLSKPTRGLEPRTPSLRVKCSTS